MQHLSREVNNVVDFLAKLGMSRDAAGSLRADHLLGLFLLGYFKLY